jgi:EXLDI family protein
MYCHEAVSESYDDDVPNKTIYVSDEDLALYTRAQELAGGNLSSAIVSALRRFVEVEEGRREGYEEVTVRVGPGHGRLVRFSGHLLGEWGNSWASDMQLYRIYRSRTGKFVVHLERTADWHPRDQEGNTVTGWRAWLGIGNFTWGQSTGESTLDIYDSFDALREKIPPSLFEQIAEVVEHPAVEDLDI